MSGIFRPGVLSLPGNSARNLGAAVIRGHDTQDNLQLPSVEPRAEQLRDALRSMEQMFPDFIPRTATELLKAYYLTSENFDTAYHLTLDYFLENGFRKSSDANGASTSNAAPTKAENGPEHQDERELVDLTFSDADEIDQEAELYEDWCVYRLSEDFPRIGLPFLKKALEVFQGKLDLTYKAVNVQYQRAAKKRGVEFIDVGFAADQGSEDVSWLPKGRLKLLKKERLPRVSPDTECPRFESDWKALQSQFRNEGGCDDDVSSNAGGELEPVPPAGIECGCCYAENLFEELVQCADGHLFCTDCLRRHLEGYIFGGSRACGLPLCLDTNGCDKTFPWSEVERALPPDVLSKYEQRQAEDAVARAQLEGLVYCPFCNHPWEVDPGMAVLRCHNEVCKKASCIKCKEPDHLPQRCEEVEKKSETSLRRKVEEKMTRALIRECASCKAELVKLEGCNKITCRCGQSMCYVCRTPIRDYSHFCQFSLQHAREPGKQCKDCAGCNLWEKENEAEVVEAAKKAAIQEVGAQEPGLLKREIGPSEVEKHVKKQRVLPFPRY